MVTNLNLRAQTHLTPAQLRLRFSSVCSFLKRWKLLVAGVADPPTHPLTPLHTPHSTLHTPHSTLHSTLHSPLSTLHSTPLHSTPLLSLSRSPTHTRTHTHTFTVTPHPATSRPIIRMHSFAIIPLRSASGSTCHKHKKLHIWGYPVLYLIDFGGPFA